MASKKQHGGRREGAGRKPADGLGSLVVAVRLYKADIARVERWMEAEDVTFSAAVRAMLALASAHAPP